MKSVASWAWWYISVIPALEKMRQDLVINSKPAWAA
jgi:hypothetical protein